METKKNTNTQNPDKMTRVQKVIVILTAVILAIILIVVAATRFMGGSDPYPIGEPSGSLTDNSGDTSGDTTTSGEDDDVTDGTKPDESKDPSSSTGTDDTDTTPPDTSSNGGNNSEGDDGKQDDTDNSGDSDDDDKKDPDNNGTDGSDPGKDEGDDSDDGNDDDGNSDDGKTDSDDGQSGNQGGITDGSSVTIVSIGSSTIEFRIGNETVVIPVQTTVFNGRVTKSGVISDSLCGYSIGASIMLYYPEDSVPDGITLTGAYVKVDSTRLTVSADYNGEGTKAVFRLNGVKLP